MIIKNVKVFTEDYRFEDGEVSIDGSVFGTSHDDVVIDGEGCYAIPGLNDIHFHGCVGHDFCDGTVEAFRAMAKYEASCGVTGIVPATMTLAEETLAGICSTAKDFQCEGGSVFFGIDMEGPFVSMAKKGAQNGDFIRKPDVAMFRRLNELSGGKIKIVAIAPEEENALSFIQELKGETVLSIAHTTADYETAMKAFENGASHVTHLYNAMPPYTHRAPGVIGASADSDCRVELICDGVHVHPAVIRSTFRMFGPDKVILISDSMMATGMPDGDYSLGGQPVKVVGNLATLADGTIAGSATNLMDCVRKAVSFGIPLEVAVRCASVNPAKEVGIFDQTGSITDGKLANLVLLDSSLATKAVFVKGKPIV